MSGAQRLRTSCCLHRECVPKRLHTLTMAVLVFLGYAHTALVFMACSHGRCKDGSAAASFFERLSRAQFVSSVAAKLLAKGLLLKIFEDTGTKISTDALTINWTGLKLSCALSCSATVMLFAVAHASHCAFVELFMRRHDPMLVERSRIKSCSAMAVGNTTSCTLSAQQACCS